MNSSEQTQSKIVQSLFNPVFVCLILAIATLAVFWPVTQCDFLNYDDPEYFTENPHVLSGLKSENILWAFTTGHAGNWHPLTWLSLMLDAQISGKNPFVPHLTNLIFHTANAVLLFLLLRKLTGAQWRSAIVAALFALHPLHVESVAWVAERKDVLSAFFGLLTLFCYARFVEETDAQNSGSKMFYFLALLLFVFGLMSKPMLVTLPFLLLLLDFWPLQRLSASTFQRRLFEKIPFFLLALVTSIVTFLVQKKGGAVAGLTDVPVSLRIENAFVSYARYLGKTFWPEPLANPYPLPKRWPPEIVWLSLGLFCGICLVSILLARKRPFVFTGWFWFVGTLVPVIGIVQVGDAAMADRYTYLPLIGIFVLVVWGITGICAELNFLRLPLIFLMAITLILCGFRTRDQLRYWQNNEIFFRHALAFTKNNYTAYNNLGTWLAKEGRTAEAMNYFFKSLQINPNDTDVLYNLGNGFSRLGDLNSAIENYQRALQIKPDQPDVLNNLGFAFATQKKFDEAIACFEKSLELKPDSADALNNLASVEFRQGKFENAGRHFYESLRLNPADARIYANLGDTLVRLEKIPAAIECYQQALRLKPDDTATKTKLQLLESPPLSN